MPEPAAQLQADFEPTSADLKADLIAERRYSKLVVDGVIPLGLALLRETDLDRLLSTLLHEGRRLAGADGATLYMRRGEVLEYDLVVNISLGIEASRNSEESVSFPPLPLYNPDGEPNLTNAACYTVYHRTALNIPDIRDSAAFDFSGPRHFDEEHKYLTLSMLTVPVVGWGGGIVAVLQFINALDPDTGERIAFPDQVQHGVESIATLAAGALESFEVRRQLYEREQAYLTSLVATQARLRKELDDAEGYVRAILPPPIDHPLNIDWHLAPCSELGGDAFGYHQIDPDHWALYILDVCGHGLSAALLSVTVAKMLRTGALPGVDFRDPSAVLSVLNNAFLMREHNNFYFTIWYGSYELSSRTLRYASAGHAPAILVDPLAGKAEKLPAKGLVLGALENKVYAAQSRILPPGATLYLLSDGVYEVTQRNGVMWPFDDFLDLLLDLPHAEANALIGLHRSVLDLRHPEPLEDDFSIVRIRT